MSNLQDADLFPNTTEYLGHYQDGAIYLSAKTGWPNGTLVTVRVADLTPGDAAKHMGLVIVAGFGLSGRWVIDIFDRHGIEYIIVDENHETVDTQRRLGRRIMAGNIADEHTLREAGIANASILILTMPDEDEVLRATKIARALKPDIYIVARTTHVSAGMKAAESGANEVIKAEQVVARSFYEMLLRRVAASDAHVNRAGDANQSPQSPNGNQ